MIPNYSVKPLMPEDLPAVISLLCESKLHLVINRLIYYDWPNEKAQRANYGNAVESALKNSECESLKVVSDETGEIVAHLFLTRIAASQGSEAQVPETQSGPQERSVPDGIVPELFDLVQKTTLEIDEATQGIEHLSLTHIYVTPSHRGRGIGTNLMKLCQERGVQAGLPVVACSEPQVHQFLLKRGFQDTKHADMDLTRYAPELSGFGIFRLWGMIFDTDKPAELSV